jgi:hypothetical protein
MGLPLANANFGIGTLAKKRAAANRQSRLQAACKFRLAAARQFAMSVIHRIWIKSVVLVAGHDVRFCPITGA